MPQKQMPKTTPGKRKDTQQESMGYPALEELLGDDQPDLTGMLERHSELSDLSKTAKTAKEKAAAKQAGIAYERFLELFKALADIKLSLMDGQKKEKAVKKK